MTMPKLLMRQMFTARKQEVQQRVVIQSVSPRRLLGKDAVKTL